MDHDRLFKELFSNFFVELIELFLPDLATYMDRDAAVVPINNEVFTDVARETRRLTYPQTHLPVRRAGRWVCGVLMI